jgi:putative phosphoesterase
VDEIWHAGDHGDFKLLDTLRKLAPLEYVSGNIDGWAEPLTLTKTIKGHKLHLLHRLSDLAPDPVAEGISLVISGHSHQPALQVKNGVTFLNPGAAGKKRFSLPVSLAIVTFTADSFEVEFFNLMDDRPLP